MNESKLQIIDGRFSRNGEFVRPEIGDREQTALLRLWTEAAKNARKRRKGVTTLPCPWCGQEMATEVTPGVVQHCPACGEGYHWSFVSKVPRGWFEILPEGVKWTHGITSQNKWQGYGKAFESGPCQKQEGVA